jgi:hypothetical protein
MVSRWSGVMGRGMMAAIGRRNSRTKLNSDLTEGNEGNEAGGGGLRIED